MDFRLLLLTKKIIMKTIFKIFAIALFSFSCSQCKTEEPEPENPEQPNQWQAADVTVNWSKAWGTGFSDDFSGGIVDSHGNMFFVGASEPDGYAADIFVVKVNLSSQSVEWAKKLDSGERDYQPSPSENGHSNGGGGSRCIALDSDGGVIIAGTTLQGFNEVFVIKLSTSGSIVWQRFWKADLSGLAHGAAKAYAMDVSNGKVFVTGATGGGDSNEEAKVFMLVLNSNDGSIDPSTAVGIDASAGYNDRGYSIKCSGNGDVYIAGWEGKDNSGFLMKYSANGTQLEWYERINAGVASRITDIDLDINGNIYLACDLRGVSTFLGVIKLNSNGDLIWSQKFQGEANDRNNISSIRVIGDTLYVGGRGSFTNYDLSQFGDGFLMKMDFNGQLIKKYNYFTGSGANDRCGERIECILPYGNGIVIAGETWPEYSTIAGNWYIPQATSFPLQLSFSKPSDVIYSQGDGVTVSRTMNISSISQNLFSPSEGSRGSADVFIHYIKQ